MAGGVPVSAVRALRAALMATFGQLLPQLVHACAVCGGGNPANRFAFFASTIALSLIPLALFAAAFVWLRSRIRSQFSDEFHESDEPVSTAARSATMPGAVAAPPIG